MKKLAVFGTFVAGAAVGFVSCGVLTMRTVLKSEKVRKAIADVIVDSAVEYLIPEQKNSANVRNHRNNSKVSYRTYYTQKADKCLYETSRAAEDALESMRNIIAEYGQMSLQDFYDVCGMNMGYRESYSTTGWVDLTDAKVAFTGRGYEIIMPMTVNLDA